MKGIIEMKNKQTYSEEQKQEILARADKIGIHKAAKEFGLTWQMVTSWNKQRNAGISLAQDKVKSTYESKRATSRSSVNSDNVESESPIATNNSRLELENAVLKERAAALALQVERLKKAVTELI